MTMSRGKYFVPLPGSLDSSLIFFAEMKASSAIGEAFSYLVLLNFWMKIYFVDLNSKAASLPHKNLERCGWRISIPETKMQIGEDCSKIYFATFTTLVSKTKPVTIFSAI